MRTNHLKKGLTVDIIALFIGVGVYPAVASVPIRNTNILQIEELESSVITDSEEDCNCQPVSKLHLIRLKRLVNRLVVYNNILLLLSKHHPEVAEKYQEISDRITELREMTNELKTDLPLGYNPFICFTLFILMFQILLLIGFMGNLIQIFPTLKDIIEKIANWIGDSILVRILNLLVEFECIVVSY